MKTETVICDNCKKVISKPKPVLGTCVMLNEDDFIQIYSFCSSRNYLGFESIDLCESCAEQVVLKIANKIKEDIK